jgi:hypothetical protein
MPRVETPSSITFYVEFDRDLEHGEPGETLKARGISGRANARLRREAGWYIPDHDYSVKWEPDAKGEFEILPDRYVRRRGYTENYMVCGLPSGWKKGTWLKRTVLGSTPKEGKMAKFKVGDRVRVIGETAGWGNVEPGAVGTVMRVSDGVSGYNVNFPEQKGWYGEERCFELVTDEKTGGGGTMAKRTRESMIEEVMERTFSPESADAVKFSERARKISALAAKIGGCSKEPLYDLVEELAGEKIPRGDAVARALVGSLIVPMTCENSHDYRIGDTVLVTKDTDGNNHHCVRVNGSGGNWMSTLDKKSWRRPTYKEAMAFLKEVPERNIETVLS